MFHVGVPLKEVVLWCRTGVQTADTGKKLFPNFLTHPNHQSLNPVSSVRLTHTVVSMAGLQSSLNERNKRGLVSGAAFGYSQGVTFWVFAIMFYVGAIMVDQGKVEYENFFTAMFAVIFGAFGVGQVRN